MLSLNCKNVQHVKIYKKVPQLKMSDNCEELLKLDNFGQKIALVIADPLSKNNLGRGSPFNVSYQHYCKKT
jgi:hypothetical protein